MNKYINITKKYIYIKSSETKGFPRPIFFKFDLWIARIYGQCTFLLECTDVICMYVSVSNQCKTFKSVYYELTSPIFVEVQYIPSIAHTVCSISTEPFEPLIRTYYVRINE